MRLFEGRDWALGSADHNRFVKRKTLRKRIFSVSVVNYG
jgi:hypothetical protein